MQQREGTNARINDWIAYATPDFDHVVQSAVERVVKALDLPRRQDIDALNVNLQRVADAVEALDSGRRLEVEEEPPPKSAVSETDPED